MIYSSARIRINLKIILYVSITYFSIFHYFFKYFKSRKNNYESLYIAVHNFSFASGSSAVVLVKNLVQRHKEVRER